MVLGSWDEASFLTVEAIPKAPQCSPSSAAPLYLVHANAASELPQRAASKAGSSGISLLSCSISGRELAALHEPSVAAALGKAGAEEQPPQPSMLRSPSSSSICRSETGSTRQAVHMQMEAVREGVREKLCQEESQWEITDELGKGAFGVVFKVRQTHPPRERRPQG